MINDEINTKARDKVAVALRSEIANGRIAPGARMPSESALAARFAVGRGTVRRALADLQSEGFIRTEHGRGSFVQEPLFPYELSRAGRFCHTLNGMNVMQSRETVRHDLVDADGRFGRTLEVPPDGQLALIEVLNFAQGLPVLLASNYVPAARFPGIADTYERQQSLSEALKLYDMAMQERRHTEIISRLPTTYEAKLLRQQKTKPITEVENMVVDQNGQPQWIEVLCFAGDRVRLVLDR